MALKQAHGVSARMAHDLAQVHHACPDAEVTISGQQRLVLRARVRGIELLLVADLRAWQDLLPQITVVAPRRLLHPLVSPGGTVRGVVSVRDWNRTFGFATVLRELARSFLSQLRCVSPPLATCCKGCCRENDTVEC